jgi:hypothetical protein
MMSEQSRASSRRQASADLMTHSIRQKEQANPNTLFQPTDNVQPFPSEQAY